MKVSFHSTVREAAGTHEIELSASTVRELLTRLRETFGERLYDMLIEREALREDVVVLVNGQNISHTGGLETPLGTDDDVAIFPPVSGG
jgi:molybdopterin synthase sulfur carrier subunit